MPIQPMRGMGSTGVNTDAPAESLPVTTWSDARNVSFRNGKVMRSPLFKTAVSLPSNPAGIASLPIDLTTFAAGGVTGADTLYLFFRNGGIGMVNTDFTISSVDSSGVTYAEAPLKLSIAELADVLYVNRADIGIRRLLPTDATFKKLENTVQGSASPWTCQVLRGYQDFLVALNVTKAGVNTPSMVKWSDQALAGQVPSNWDATQAIVPSTLAGENVLAEMQGPIIDGLALKSDFLIYGQDSVWSMTFTGDGTYPFDFRILFNTGGVLSQNCVVEVEGRHYVFGATNIYVHDGISLQTMQGVTDRVFGEKTNTAQDPAFVCHDARHQCVLFCYQSQDATGMFCDRAAVYNYVYSTWSFVDLPNTPHAHYGSLAQYPNWTAGPGVTWQDDQNNKATWQDDVVYKSALSWVGGNMTGALSGVPSYLFVYDDSAGGVFGGVSLPAFNPSAWLQRDAMVIAGEDDAPRQLSQVKQFRSVIPRFYIEQESRPATLTTTLGGRYEFGSDTVWSTPVTIDPTARHRVDTRVNGRTLGMRFEVSQGAGFIMSDLDVEFVTAGER